MNGNDAAGSNPGDRIAKLEDLLIVTLGNIRSLKWTADDVQRTNVYDDWERLVFEVVKHRLKITDK